MQFLKQDLYFDFLAKKRFALHISLALVVVSLGAYIGLGFHYGIDFNGGTVVQVKFSETQSLGDLRDLLSQSDIKGFSLQSFGDEGSNEFLITTPQTVDFQESALQGSSEGMGEKIANLLRQNDARLEVRRVESVGPKVGSELKQAAYKAILFSLVAIVIYIWLRFHWRYSVGALLALVHDLIIVGGAFVLTQKEISLPVVAAILTVAGYSINDTIVIFDRIRENFKRFPKKTREHILNESLSQTLSRTLLTSGTTLLVLCSILFFGGEIIRDFAFALFIGVFAGTYSSLFIATPCLDFLLQRFPLGKK